MKRRTESASKALDRFFERIYHPAAAEVETSRRRVLDRLQESARLPVESESRRPRVGLFAVLAASGVAAAAVIAAVVFTSTSPVDARATVRNVEGSLDRVADGQSRRVRINEEVDPGTVLQSGDRSRATLALRDGTLIELKSGSELVLEPADDGVRIRLNRGGIIVNAAVQRRGHLYVQTQDATVSVVGTVFLVSAEEEGSRIGVIQGRVQLQHSGAVRALLPGEQVVTGASMPAVPLAQEISWSRNAPEHIALLQQSKPDERSRPASPLKFDVESIRPHSGTSPRGEESMGFVCRGVDGNLRAEEHIGGNGRLTAPQGRCVGTGVFVESLIAFAYGVPVRDVLGLPEWTVAPDEPVFRRLPMTAFSIEGIAEDPASATTSQLVEMVKTMLAERFQLRVTAETREVPGYALVVAEGGHKMQVKSPTESERMPSFELDGPGGRPVIRGTSTMAALAEWLGGGNGPGSVSLPVVDKTGLTEVYEYELDPFRDLAPSGGGRGGPGQAPPAVNERPASANPLPYLEKQVGLRLIPEQSVEVEVVVVHEVEKPAAN